MKMFIKNSYLFLIFFILLFSKGFLYGLLTPKTSITLDDVYIKKLEKELNDIKVFKNYNYKISGIPGKVLYQNPVKPDELFVLTNVKEIEEGAYVLDENGLIGVVKSLEDNYAVINLITSDSFNMQVIINDCYGIYHGKEKKISNINNYCKINKKDEVYTSPLGKYDEKVLIGRIEKILINKNGLENTYYLTPKANLNSLNYVVILKGGKDI